MIGLAGGDAAGGEHEVVILRRGGDRAGNLSGLVGQDAEIGHRGAEAREHRREQAAVRIIERGGRTHRARLDDLVAGREQRDAHAPPHVQRREAERSREREMLGLQPPASGQRDRTAAQILASKARVGAALEARRHDHGVAVAPAILLHEHGVGARRHRRAGEDADRLARRETALRGAPRGHAIDDRKPRLARLRKIGVAHRVTVDRRIVERRKVDARGDVARYHPALRLGDIDALDLVHRHHALDDQALRLGDRHQRPGERETIVGKLRHHDGSKGPSS